MHYGNPKAGIANRARIDSLLTQQRWRVQTVHLKEPHEYLTDSCEGGVQLRENPNMQRQRHLTPRLYVDSALAEGSRIELPESAAHHDIERESPLAVTLVQAVSSSEKMDFTIQKAVELGVAAIQPVLTAKSVVRLSAEREEKKLARWRRVVIAACEQCGRNRLPILREAMSVADYTGAPRDASLRLLLSPEGKTGLGEMKQQIGHTLTIAAGPEAGFSDEEERLLQRAGFVPVRLGQRILRTETAALAALAALNAIAGDF